MDFLQATLMPVDAYAIIDGSFAGDVDREIGPYCNVPNLKCSPITSSQRARAEQRLRGGSRDGSVFYSTSRPRLLKDIVERIRQHVGYDGTYRFDWICCQATRLVSTSRGGENGMNARHYVAAKEFVFFDRSVGGKVKLGRRKAS